NHSESGTTPVDARQARPASTAIVVESSSYDATAREPLPPPVPATGAIWVRSSRRCGTCAPQPRIPRMRPGYANLTTRQIRGGTFSLLPAGTPHTTFFRSHRRPKEMTDVSPKPNELTDSVSMEEIDAENPVS